MHERGVGATRVERHSVCKNRKENQRGPSDLGWMSHQLQREGSGFGPDANPPPDTKVGDMCYSSSCRPPPSSCSHDFNQSSSQSTCPLQTQKCSNNPLYNQLNTSNIHVCLHTTAVINLLHVISDVAIPVHAILIDVDSWSVVSVFHTS